MIWPNSWIDLKKEHKPEWLKKNFKQGIGIAEKSLGIAGVVM